MTAALYLTFMSEEINSYATQPSANPQTVIVNVDQKKSNSMGTAGFVLALLAIVFSWVPAVDFILWFLGALFSFIGLFKSPRGLAITGFILSFIGIIIILAIVGSVGAVLASQSY